MQTHANTLFVQTQGAYLRKDHETVQVQVDGAVKLAVPLHHLESIVCFGRVSLSPGMMEICADRNMTIAMLTEQGRLQARIVPAQSGNVLMRREQYRRADQPESCRRIAKSIVAAKIQNCRMLLLRAARETDDVERVDALRHAADRLACSGCKRSSPVSLYKRCNREIASVSNCRIRSRVTLSFSPISRKVFSSPSSSPKRILITSRSLVFNLLNSSFTKSC